MSDVTIAPHELREDMKKIKEVVESIHHLAVKLDEVNSHSFTKVKFINDRTGNMYLESESFEMSERDKKIIKGLEREYIRLLKEEIAEQEHLLKIRLKSRFTELELETEEDA